MIYMQANSANLAMTSSLSSEQFLKLYVAENMIRTTERTKILYYIHFQPSNLLNLYELQWVENLK